MTGKACGKMHKLTETERCECEPRRRSKLPRFVKLGIGFSWDFFCDRRMVGSGLWLSADRYCRWESVMKSTNNVLGKPGRISCVVGGKWPIASNIQAVVVVSSKQ